MEKEDEFKVIGYGMLEFALLRVAGDYNCAKEYPVPLERDTIF